MNLHDLRKEYLRYKLNEYRQKRDTKVISSRLSFDDYSWLLKQIKKRLALGQNLSDIVKDEISKLIKKYKDLSSKVNIEPLVKSTKIDNLTEGGNIFSDVGKIYKTEVKPTLDFIERSTGISTEHVLGSVGKKDYSGDIDIAVEHSGDTDQKIQELREILVGAFGANSVKTIGKLISARVPIQRYDRTKVQEQPRTGYIQVDFILGDTKWLSLFYHSAGSDTKYKGVHRNMMITAICSVKDVKKSDHSDEYGTPVSTERWKWSATEGLVRVRRNLKKKEDGTWTKNTSDEVISKPITDATTIAKTLLGDSATPADLNSLETLVRAVKRHFDKDTADMIFAKAAQNFKETLKRNYNDWFYPPEIQKYI